MAIQQSLAELYEQPGQARSRGKGCPAYVRLNLARGEVLGSHSCPPTSAGDGATQATHTFSMGQAGTPSLEPDNQQPIAALALLPRDLLVTLCYEQQQ
jgi:hypothetical protein